MTATQVTLQEPAHALTLQDVRGVASTAASTSPVDSEPGSPQQARVFRVQEQWNNPKKNVYKLASVFLAFINCGMNDASYGALLPSLQPYYNINYTTVSLIFLTPFAGYATAALVSNPLHVRLGRRGIAVLGTLPRIIAYLVLSFHPPYPVVVVIYGLVGLGIGLVDAGWNAWVGNLSAANELLGFMHGFYGLGATIAPLIVSALVERAGKGWFTFYYVMVGLVALEFATTLATFWTDTGAKFREENESSGEEKGGARAAVGKKVTWICSAFLLAYVGTEVTLGGWIIEFMRQIRHGEPFPSGLTATGFWLGITLGRVVLGFVTPRIGEKIAVSAYLLLSMGMELIFWLVPQFVVSAVAVGLLGFFMGPLFPASIVATTKILPQRLHVAAIGISASIGGIGAAVLPFGVGAVAQKAGVQTLQPIVLGLIAVLLGVWLTLPRIPRHAHAD
ncbi:MAG: hypothetical protein Q9162_006166 [Coniocarpon cinnabarinum]